MTSRKKTVYTNFRKDDYVQVLEEHLKEFLELVEEAGTGYCLEMTTDDGVESMFVGPELAVWIDETKVVLGELE